MSNPNQIFTGDGSRLNKPSSMETMNDLLGSGYQIVSMGQMDSVVLAKLPNEDLAPTKIENLLNHTNEDERMDIPFESESSSPSKPEKTTDDYIFQFYLGSLTVVGLFILFRMIQKSK